MDLKNTTDNHEARIEWYDVSLTFIVSCLAWPLVYIFHSIVTSIEDEAQRPIWLLILCILLFTLLYLFIRMLSKRNDYFYYVVTMLSFSSMGSLIMFLEKEGIVSNFISEYFTWCEPYLNSSYGGALLLYDGTVFYTIYLLLSFSTSNGMIWRSLKLYWLAGMMCANACLILAALVGKHNITPCIVMNFPYAVCPAVFLVRTLQSNQSVVQEKPTRNGKLEIPVDIFLILGLVISMGICAVKGMAVISYPATSGLIHELLQIEPILLLQDPAPFTIVQSLMYLFYLVPLHLFCIGQLVFNWKPRFSLDAALILAGIIMALQFNHIVAAIHPHTPIGFKSDYRNLSFWIVNLSPIFISHLLVYRMSLQRNENKKINKNK